MMSGALLVASILALTAVAASLVRRFRLLAALGTALAFGGLARAVEMAWGAPPMDLTDLFLWPGYSLRTGVAVGMDLPLALGGYTWSLPSAGAPWLVFWLAVGAGAALLGLASSEEGLPAWVALALLGGVGLAAGGSPASGLWGGMVLLGTGAVMLRDRDAALAFLGGGVVGLVALLLALGEPPLGPVAAVLSLAFWFGCPPWGAWALAACRRGEPVAVGFALAFLPALGWNLLRPAVGLMGPAWFLGGAVGLLGVGGVGALVHRDVREVWHDCALLSLGLVALIAARAGPEAEEIAWALAWRSAALGLPALGLAGGPGEEALGPLPGKPWRAFLLLVGLAALAGLPPLPAFGLWRSVLAPGGDTALPGWAVGVALGALGAGALGWWKALRCLLTTGGKG